MKYKKNISALGVSVLTAVMVLMSAWIMPACSDDNGGDLKGATLSVTADGVDITDMEFSTYGGQKMITLVTNAAWKMSVEDTPEWISLSNRSGEPASDEDPRYIKVSVSPLGDVESRTASISVRAGGIKKTITVTQRRPASTDGDGWETANSANNNMAVGVNLMNTLDAVGDWFDQDDVSAFETCWGQPLAKQEWFDAVAAAGFGVVRIPVTWYPHMDENWIVKEPWMRRVEEVVNYGLNAGLYVILNVHHDTGDGDKNWLKADYANIDVIGDKFCRLWTQIATRFNKYGEKLLFEGYNEMLDADNSWVEPTEISSYEAVNMFAQMFVNTVRATGGNNMHRNLIVNTYGSGGSRTRLDNMVLPEDKIPGHILLEVHNYSPSAFSNLMGEIDDENLPVWTPEFEKTLGVELDLLIGYSQKFGVPVVIGECGSYDKIADEERAKYGKFLSTYSLGKANVSMIHWGNIMDRNTCEPMSPLYVEGLLEGKKGR